MSKKLSRRQFIQAMSTASAGLLLSSSQFAMAQTSNEAANIVILGCSGACQCASAEK